jgi:hypothetical protein
VVEQASIYETYVQKAAAIDAAFTGGDKVAESLRTGEHYAIGQFQHGQVAYGAIVALQDQAFVAGLREFAKDPARRSEIAARIMADPAYAGTFKGADSAAGLVVAAFSDQGKKLLATGARIRQSAYDVQHQSWSKADVPDRPGRLALAKTLSNETQNAIEVDTLRLSENAKGTQAMGLAAPPVSAPYTPVVARSLAVAAMAALGEGGDEYTPQLQALLAEGAEEQCLNMAKLNLYQCLAVSKPHYEDVFCLGQHAVEETGQCIMKSAVVHYAPAPAAAPAPAETKPVLASSSKKRPLKKKAPGRSDSAD